MRHEKADNWQSKCFDYVIIGAGAGGATLAYSLAATGKEILLLERGDFLPVEASNWDPEAVFRHWRYRTTERWQDGESGKAIAPNEYYWVGGKTKVYGAALYRLREKDFLEYPHESGKSPAWPLSYHELEPYYSQAEQLFRVHGQAEADPTAPFRSQDYPFAAIPRDEYIQELADRLQSQGVQPFSIPVGIDLRPGGKCVFCRWCDSYPCQVHAKSDAQVCCLTPALQYPNVQLLTKAYAYQLETHNEEIVAVRIWFQGKVVRVRAKNFVVSCGAIPSAALLLNSKNKDYPQGLANRSGLVGKNLMFHNISVILALHWLRKNPTVFQKQLSIFDYYFEHPDWSYPLGIAQMIGQLPFEYAVFPRGWEKIGRFITEHSIQLFALSEDLPDSNNRVAVGPQQQIKIFYQPNNQRSHHKLVQVIKKLIKKAGYSWVLSVPYKMPENAGGHAAGTLKMGDNPETSVLNSFCQTHDHPNLYAVDSSFFPSVGSVNPALTIIAQALRVGEHLKSLEQ